MGNFNGKLFLGLVVFLIGAGLTTLFVLRQNGTSGIDSSQVTSTLGRDRLVIGTDATYPPMEFLEDGEVQGIGIDVAKAVADKLGVAIEIRQVPWEELFEGVDAGDIDLAVSSITITPERQEKHLFSRSYFESGQSIVVASGNDEILLPADLEGKKLAAHEDTTSYEESVKYAGSADLVEVYLGSIDRYVEMLVAGDIDAIVIDYPAGLDVANNNEGVKVANQPFTSESYGMMTKLERTDLMSFVNLAIEEMKEDGTLDQIVSKWSK